MKTCRLCGEPIADEQADRDHGRGAEHADCHRLDCDMPWQADPITDAAFLEHVYGD